MKMMGPSNFKAFTTLANANISPIPFTPYGHLLLYNMTVAQNEISEEREFIAFMKMRNSNVHEKGNFQSTDKHHLEISKT